ncbi:MAG: hypothetical protein IAE91_11845 [Ignavibacteriaceae bacterium]|nr:hypothetical protein [Ignavibacteriaceae bacterium]
MKKSQVYFIMYIVLITELLVIITERDELHEKEQEVKQKMVLAIAEQYKRPISLIIPTPTTTKEVNADTVVVAMTTLGLVSDAEKQNVKYFVRQTSRAGAPVNEPLPGGQIQNNGKQGSYLLESSGDGNAIFIIFKPNRPGDYSYTAYCTVDRVLPDYLPEFLLEELKKAIGEDLKEARSADASFTIKITATNEFGAARPGLD